MRIKARTGLLRAILGSGRTPAWEKADCDFHASHTLCEMCAGKAGPIGPPFERYNEHKPA